MNGVLMNPWFENTSLFDAPQHSVTSCGLPLVSLPSRGDIVLVSIIYGLPRKRRSYRSFISLKFGLTVTLKWIPFLMTISMFVIGPFHMLTCRFSDLAHDESMSDQCFGYAGNQYVRPRFLLSFSCCRLLFLLFSRLSLLFRLLLPRKRRRLPSIIP